MNDDAKYKSLFSHPRVRRDLLRGFVSKDLAGLLDLDTLQMMPTEFVDARLGQQRSDMVWRVNFREGKGELYVVVLTEFQSTVDRDMPLRMAKYTAQIYTKLLEEERRPAGWKLPPVLPVVVYSGEARWSAPQEMEEMVAPVDEELLPFQLRQRYFLLDLRRVGVEDAAQDNVLYAQALIEQGRWKDLWSALSALQEAIDPEDEAKLRGLVAALVRQAAEGSGQVTDEMLKKLKSFEETGELGEMGSLLAERMDQAVDESRSEGKELGLAEGKELGLAEGKELGFAEGKELGFAEGKELGLAEGKELGLAEAKELGLAEAKELGLERQRAILLRQAARKFDASTATRLEALLAAVDDPDRLAGLGDHVIDCDDGEELLSRVTGAAKLH